ncbi:hypothetical protein FQN60_006940 [Etheostoma spectabile]|uniref:Uncharacterized protein n=1 Tax=Etheostoma spectabile TaxID=54343 RepID=A0A5J5CDQ0_9PERO|nr:hypothetical protein FQN60_006940 [Etheostoma spectabile]
MSREGRWKEEKEEEEVEGQPVEERATERVPVSVSRVHRCGAGPVYPSLMCLRCGNDEYDICVAGPRNTRPGAPLSPISLTPLLPLSPHLPHLPPPPHPSFSLSASRACLVSVFDLRRGRTDSPRETMSNGYSSAAPSPEPLQYTPHLEYQEPIRGEIEVNEAILKATRICPLPHHLAPLHSSQSFLAYSTIQLRPPAIQLTSQPSRTRPINPHPIPSPSPPSPLSQRRSEFKASDPQVPSHGRAPGALRGGRIDGGGFDSAGLMEKDLWGWPPGTPLLVRSSSDSALAPSHEMSPDDHSSRSSEVEINNVLKGALDRLRTNEPPAMMSLVNFRYFAMVTDGWRLKKPRRASEGTLSASPCRGFVKHSASVNAEEVNPEWELHLSHSSFTLTRLVEFSR